MIPFYGLVENKIIAKLLKSLLILITMVLIGRASLSRNDRAPPKYLAIFFCFCFGFPLPRDPARQHNTTKQNTNGQGERDCLRFCEEHRKQNTIEEWKKKRTRIKIKRLRWRWRLIKVDRFFCLLFFLLKFYWRRRIPRRLTHVSRAVVRWFYFPARPIGKKKRKRNS